MGVDALRKWNAIMQMKCDLANVMRPCSYVNERECSFVNGMQPYKWNAIFKIENAAWQNWNRFENAALQNWNKWNFAEMK